MTNSTPLPYYVVYCPIVMLASCYKSVKGMAHHDHEKDHEANHLHKKVRHHREE